ncbi:MAG TPA: hypothetical protein VHH36_05085 [Candidatus Thermoplasmatota archaeon]|nr:hypothetical protein [Candidatus Thermoplasmatota archaeon]
MESERLLTRAALLSLLASLLHGAAAPGHLDEWWGYGAFFLLAAGAQGVFGLAILLPRVMHEAPITRLWPARNRRAFYAAGVAGNLAIVALYVVTRTVGIPFFGPEAGTVEDVGFLDAASKVTEVLLVACLAVLLRQSVEDR